MRPLKASFVAVEDDPRRRRRRGERLGQRCVALSRVGRAGRDINESRNLGMNADFSHDHAREGMSSEHGRPVLPVQHALRLRHRIVKRRQRLLNGRYIQPRGLQARDDLRPAGSVGEQPMNQNDVSGAKDVGGVRHAGRQADRGAGPPPRRRMYDE